MSVESGIGFIRGSYSRKRVFVEAEGMDKAAAPEKICPRKRRIPGLRVARGRLSLPKSGSEEHERCTNLDPPLAVGCGRYSCLSCLWWSSRSVGAASGFWPL